MNNYKSTAIVCASIIFLAIYFAIATPVMMDDGFHYQGFAESLARGDFDFKSFYGFQGLGILAVPIFWLTHSHISIIITSMILSLLSIPLAYGIGKKLTGEERGGFAGIILFLLMPYPYMTMMRGFQEAALLFFILLIIYGALREKPWTGLAWGLGAIVKPFALVLAPLFLKRESFRHPAIWFLIAGCAVGVAYVSLNHAQTGHWVTLAATGAYEGVFDPTNVPALEKSFAVDWKTWARVGTNLFVSSRKIMIAPLLVVIGAWSLWQTRREPWTRRVMMAIGLNVLLVGPITYAFPKYLLPMTTLLALSAIPLLLKRPALWGIVFIDSIWMFYANYAFFGKIYWNPSWLAWLPFLMAIILCIYVVTDTSSDTQRA